MTELPFPLRFAISKPAGFPSYIRNTTFSPTTIYNDLTLNDTIRFEIKSKAFLDPYSLMINIDLQVDPLKFPNYFIQKLDQSAHSLFSEMTISSKGTVLEHIQEYDGLASVLHDMNFNAQYRRSRAYEGHANSVYQFRTEAEGFMNANRNTAIYSSSMTSAQQTFFDPLTCNACFGTSARLQEIGNPGWVKTGYKTMIGPLEDGTSQTTTFNQIRTTTYGTGIYSTVRGLDVANVAALSGLSNAIANNNVAATLPTLIQNIWRYEHMMQFTPTEGYEPADTVTNESEIREIVHGITGITSQAATTSLYQYTGYTNPRVAAFADCCQGEPFFCGTGIRTLEMYRGKPKRSVNGRYYLSFTVPLLSCFFGVLLPPDQFKYIPLAGFEDLVIELKLNQYAFYTSGYQDAPSTTGWTIPTADHSALAMTQIYRSWLVKKIELNCDLISFDSRVEQMIDQQLSSSDGIILQSAGWCLGPQYQFSNTASVQGTYQINMGFNSLKSFIFYFQPLDYVQYHFCRKQYRISHNLTKFYLSIGQDQFPLDGVKGHAGQVWSNTDTNMYSNKTFLINLFKAFNKLHDMRGNCVISPYNYAINDRPYDPTKKGSYITTANLTTMATSANSATPAYMPTLATAITVTADNAGLATEFLWPGNTHTAAGLPLFHETRCIGKCVYGLDCETMSNDFSVLSGLNTTDFKPFNIVLEVDSIKNQFLRDSRMNIFFYYDTVIQIRKGQFPIVSGRQ